MKRLRRTVLSLLVIALVLTAAFLYNGLYFTPRAVMDATERGLHYGPSQQMLLEYDGTKGARLMVGKVDDRSFSAVPVQRTWLVFWKLKSGGVRGQSVMYSGYHTVYHTVASYEHAFQLFYGLTDCPEAASVSVELCAHSDSGDRVTQATLEVDENGFFYLPEYQLSDEEYNRYLSYTLTVYDAEGNQLCQDIFG